MKKLSFLARASSPILLALLLLLGATTTATAQTPGSRPMTDIYGHMGIGTIAPDKSAILDLSTTTAGFLMPRLTSAERNALVNPATGLMIFNTDTKTIEFNIGTTFAPIWDPVLTVSTGSGIFWSLTGNGGTNPATNFIGTTDGQPLVVRTNNMERLRVATTGEVGIGTAAPTAGRLLEVAGTAGAANVRFGSASGAADGSVWTPGANDGVITADGNGDLLKRTSSAVVGSVAWLRTGNAGTTAGTNFVGTTDNVAFEIRVNNSGAASGGNQRVMRFEPNATSPNIIGGFNGNSVTAGVMAATISGGGMQGATNTISSNYSTIGGGRSNSIGASSINSTIAGGVSNQVGASAGNGTVSGGLGNVIVSGDHTTIGGGFNNRINTGAYGSTLGGGTNNIISSHTSVLDGGNGNVIGTSSQFSTIGGGHQNTINNSAFESVIAGGTTDTIETGATYSTIGGGTSNVIRSSSTRSVIAGGYNNEVSADRATISGGELNVISGARSAIPGGRGLTLSGAGSFGFLGANTGANDMTISTSDVAVFGNTDLWLANNDNAPSELRFFEGYNAAGAFPNGTANYTAFKAQDQTGDITYTLPAALPASNGDILTSTTGGVMQWSDADSIVTANAWGLLGNAGTTAGTNFVGTTDNVAFEIRVNNTGAASGGNQRVMRFEPNATSPNIIGGFNGNSVTAGVIGATLAGGGANGNLNTVTDDYGVVGGGRNNHAGDNSGTTSDHNYATVSGGLNNTASGAGATVGGGSSNTASGIGSTVGGGQFNTVSNSSATVGGGRDNMASRDGSTVGGGVRDTASGDNATVGGGFTNTASGDASTVGGGASNTASAAASTVGGGRINTASGLHSMVGGGSNNTALGSYSTVGGGVSDTASGLYSTVSGGLTNTASGDASTVGGGYSNTAAGHYSAIPGGTGLTLDADADGSFGFLGGNTGSNNMTISTPDVAVFGNANLWLANNNNAPSELRFFEAYNTAGAFPNTANYTAFKAQDQTSDITYTLPASPAASNGDILTSTTGGVMQWSDADSIVTANAWSLLGNAGTTAGTNFVGTTDNVAFEIRVNNTGAATGGNQRVMRFEPNATSPNIIGGFNGNSVTAGVVGATISGGGINGGTNVISSNYSTIGGGRSNAIGASSSNSTIAGGVSNQVGASAGNGTVSGGLGNVIVSGDHTTIGGGFNNRINTGAFGSTLGGGTNNIASSHTSVIDGGNANSIGTSSQFSTIGGGHQNTINNSAFESVIAGGTTDTIETGATYSTIGGGTSNAIRSSSTRSVIAGGYNNEVSADRSTISGGELNVISGARSAIPGGRGLTLSGAGSFGFLGGNGGSNDMTISAANVAVFGNTDLWLANNDNAPSELRFFEAETGTGAFPSGTNYTAFKAQDQTADITYTLPAAAPAGAGNGVLTANAAGTMSWGSHRRVAAVAGTAQVIADPAITATSTVIVTIEGTVASGTITARTAGTNFTVTTNVALATTDFINYIILP